ncbi:hypothetical protein IV500_08125 [Paeniglutamicibacter antarcticus]|uniref:Uncharacterized protein n=1 Tax=Arthrobacter terrae TaxID=2935737 RepID=A0A931CNC7_9MICC|nr:hypothetical protein [Arthrobacter terrae]MBG0739355.1 hypothetical protein [Arthrobacter terrae]
MSDSRRHRYAQLLRWYPQPWREEHGSIMLDTLDQHASDRGIARPSVPEAWSLRAHGLGARATPRWAAGTAATALMAFIAATWLMLSNAIMFPGADMARLLLAVFIGPLTLALSAVVLLHRTGQLCAPAALFTAAFVPPACAFAALTAASWAVGFNEADAGLGLSWFGSSTLLFLIVAWMAGTMSLLAPVGLVLRKKRPAPIRLAQRGALAAIASLVLGALMLMGQIVGILVAAVLLVLALRPDRATRPAALFEDDRAAARGFRQGQPAVLTRWRETAAGAAAMVSLIMGIGCAVFALTGGSWAPSVTDSTHAMNLGLAAGALAAIPAVIAAGMVLTLRFGVVIRWSALLCCGSLVMETAAQLLGAGHSSQWPLTLAAAALMGFVIALPFSRLLPGRNSLRISVTTVLGLAGSSIGLLLVTMAGFIAPLGAAALFIWLVTRPSKQSINHADKRSTIKEAEALS